VIAQVHGYCLAGGTELATACDLVYVADDVQIGYPPVRTMSPPDMQFHPWMLGMRHAMELMLTGDSMDGAQAVSYGFANRAYPAEELDEVVLAHAERVAKVATDIQQMNKRSIHRAMEIMGMRAAIHAGTEIQALAFFTETSQTYRAELGKGVSAALTKRDEVFGDYRTSKDNE
jgi:enoyl-CoA hydratase